MFYTNLPAESVAKVATGPLIDYDTARDMLIESPDVRIYAYIERDASPRIERLSTPVRLSDLAPGIGFAWIGASAVPVGRAS